MGIVVKFVVGILGTAVSALLMYGGVLLVVAFVAGPAAMHDLHQRVMTTVPPAIGAVIDLGQAGFRAAMKAIQ